MGYTMRSGTYENVLLPAGSRSSCSTSTTFMLFEFAEVRSALRRRCARKGWRGLQEDVAAVCPHQRDEVAWPPARPPHAEVAGLQWAHEQVQRQQSGQATEGKKSDRVALVLELDVRCRWVRDEALRCLQ